ncbi:MAG TPA: 2-(1,2-epoxy-1,2-dihydrophenyl)acetyl-CoA isomerase, partial [Chitinophagaceae bacterium]|nr:2-(1,2-epoxy-1,2-dihydrophenyl)acetyl-CoA isomerase [Chitinophagaceae bacterium]
METSIVYRIENGVGFITLNRPDKLNSFNRAMALALQEVLDDCAHNNSVRAVLLTGAGKGFCAGQDLEEVVDPQGPGMKTFTGT